MSTYAETRREQYRNDIKRANTTYQKTKDLQQFQHDTFHARDNWHADIRAHYRNETIETELTHLLTRPGRVYAHTDDGRTARIHTVGNLYDVTDITGSPAEPLIARLESMQVLNTTVADMIQRA